MPWAFEFSKPTPSDTHPPTRLNLPILPKQLGTKHSDLRAFGDCSNRHRDLPREHLALEILIFDIT